MEAGAKAGHQVRFNTFELNLKTGELSQRGVRIRLHGQPIAVLRMLLEHPGEVVTRETLQKALWPEDVFVDFEHSLNSTINRLREALGDSAEAPRVIETIPRVGYRFIATISKLSGSTDSRQPAVRGSSISFSSTPVTMVHSPALALVRSHLAVDEDSVPSSLIAETVPVAQGPDRPFRQFWSIRRILIVASAGVALMLIAAMVYWLTRPAPVPRLTNFVQMTRDGQKKRIIGTDGSRLYLYFELPDRSAIAEMSTSGGEVRRISLPAAPDLYPVSLSPDGAKFIGRRNWSIGVSSGVTSPLWSVPIMGGTPRQLGSANGTAGELSPDGKHLVYTDAKALYISNADGTEARELAAVIPLHLTWSPDGTRIRFDRYETWNGKPLLWEISADGSNLHRLFPVWSSGTELECCGRWLPDGSYFLFQTRQHIWALRERQMPLGPAPKPIQLTSGPMRLSTPFASADGKKLYAVGTIERGELTRFDMQSRKFVSFLDGSSIEHLDFSPDGQWIAYVTYPDRKLWRAKADGSERLQLTFEGREPVEPRWSPDGKQIVYTDSRGEKSMKSFIISADGGVPQQVLPDDAEGEDDADWTPDGKEIIFTRLQSNVSIQVVDVATRKITTVPGSKDMGWARFSPNGRFIAATYQDRDLAIFNVDTQKWTILGSFGSGVYWPSWTREGDQVQLLEFSMKKAAIIRVNIHTGVIERIELGSFEEGGSYPIGWLGIAPDGSPLLLHNTGTSDVYSIDWQEE